MIITSTSHAIVRLVTTIVGAGAIAMTPLPAQSSKPLNAPQTRRFAADSFWTVKWSRGYDREEDLFIEPRILSLVDRSLVVVDLGTRDVVALDPRTGKSQVKLTARNGAGPGEVRRPHGIIPVDGGFGIIDQGNARISAFSITGRLLWDTPLPEPVIGGACMLPGQRLAIKRYSSSEIEMRDTSGKLLQVLRLPWSGSSRTGESLTHGVQMAGPNTPGHCAIAREFGSQFATLSSSGAIRSYQYVEHAPEAVAQASSRQLEKTDDSAIREVTTSTSSRQSGMAAMIRGDTLIVRFAGETPDRLFLLDYYSMIDGRYLHSRRLEVPSAFVSLTIGPDGTFYAGEIAADYAGVVAMRPTKVRPRRPKADSVGTSVRSSKGSRAFR